MIKRGTQQHGGMHCKSNFTIQLITVWLFLLFQLPLMAQEPVWREHRINEEFAKAKLNLIHEQDDEMLWFATSDGLFYYDGLQYYNVPFQDQASAHSSINALTSDLEGKIWIGTDEGKIFFQEKFGPLHLWNPDGILPSAPITGIAFGKDSSMWFSTYGEGLFLYKNNALHQWDLEDGLSGLDIYQLVVDDHNNAWVGTDLGVNICSYNNQQKLIKVIDGRHGLKDEIIRDICLDQTGNAWIGTFEGGLFYYDTALDTVSRKIENKGFGEITSLEIFQNLEIWIGTQNEGIWRASFDDLIAHPIYNMGEIKKTKITDLTKDVEGNIWVCNGSSVAYSANRQFEWALAKVANIQAVCEDKSKTVWVGTDSSLYRFKHLESGQEEWVPFWRRKVVNITSLFEDSVGKLWVGTYGEGLYCIGQDRKKVFHFTTKNSPLPDGNIFSIKEQNGKIWLATLRGVVVIKNPEFVDYEKPVIEWYNKESGLPTDYIYTVFIDSRGVAWLGTDGKGLVKILNEEITHYPSAGDIPFKSVYAITEDNEGNIWFCSSGNGIFQFDGENFTQLALPEGLRNLTISSLINDEKGNILVVHPFGIDLLNPGLKHLIYYDQEIGAENIEPNLNTVSLGNEKKIWIGTNTGLITYTALEEDLKIHPRTIIKSVSVFLEKEGAMNTKEFDYEENHLSFDCIGLWYTDPKTVEYRYMLEGYDLDWKKTRDNFISYPHLPPGDYTFKIQSTENSAFDQEPVTSYSFTIGKPFWQKLWFIIGCILLAGGAFYWYQRMRDARIHRESEMKKEKIESQFEALKSQINPHFLFNSFNTLMTVIDENPEKAMDYVQALSDFYRSIVQYREKEIIPMTEELEIVENYGYLLSQRYGENLEIVFEISDTKGYLVPLSLQMLVENAVKHNIISRSKPLKISIRQENGFIVVSNPLQLKLTPEPSTQYGLDSISKRYVYLTSKKMQLEKTETHFIVRLPIIPDR